MRELMADRAQWTGSATDLLQVGIVGGNAMAAWTRSGWPKSPRALAGRLRRAQTSLRALGIDIVFGREGRLGTRTIRITAIRFAPQTAILRDFAVCVGLIRSHPEHGQEANIRFVCVRE